MDLSVIIPVHNLENFIDPLLDSLKRQVFDSFEIEIIFVLDDCIDNTAQKLMNFEANQYKSIHLLNTCVHSCGLARNLGLEHSTGEYIWFIDGDDKLLVSDAFYQVLVTMKAGNEKIIRIDYEAPGFALKGYPSMVWQYIMRRDFIGDLRFTAIQPHEDVKFMDALMCNLQNPIHIINQPIYFYNYMREGSNMQQFKTKGKIDP